MNNCNKTQINQIKYYNAHRDLILSHGSYQSSGRGNVTLAPRKIT